MTSPPTPSNAGTRSSGNGGVAVDRYVGRAVSAAFRWVATVRGRRALHPLGAAFGGNATVHDAGGALAASTDLEAVVRFSRGIGLPHPVPDVNGVAVRLIDAHGSGQHQDLLFAAAAGMPVLRHVILPVPWFSTSGYSTILPFRAASGRYVLFRCGPLPVRTLDEVESNLPLTVTVSVATLAGRWRPAATVTLTAALEVADEDIRFEPSNTGGALTPAGLLNRLRPAAYAASRAGSAGRHGRTSGRSRARAGAVSAAIVVGSSGAAAGGDRSIGTRLGGGDSEQHRPEEQTWQRHPHR